MHFKTDEVHKAILATAGGKAPSPDGDPSDMYKAEPLAWARILTQVFIPACLCEFPSSWAKAIIRPIFKKGSRDGPACYRPISLLDLASKIMGKVILDRLTSWFDHLNFISDLQYGFR